jgi:hypothetical protein
VKPPKPERYVPLFPEDRPRVRLGGVSELRCVCAAGVQVPYVPLTLKCGHTTNSRGLDRPAEVCCIWCLPDENDDRRLFDLNAPRRPAEDDEPEPDYEAAATHAVTSSEEARCMACQLRL